MLLQGIDWAFIVGYFIISLLIGIVVTKRAGSSVSEFFLSGRTMPWWLLGVSLVATTFSTDTPNVVADMVRTHGVAGNWLWFAFALTGMLTVFVYAKLWRRSGVLTDLEFYELRYSGKAAAFLRGFRALYLGILFNVLIMASVSLAAIKIGGVMFGFTPLQTLSIAMVVTVAYSALGGFLGVLITDFFQFGVAMAGAIYAGIYAVNLPQVGGLSHLLTNEAVRGKLSLLPDFSNMDAAIAIFIIPMAVQWWASWYPGSEPGGGGYVAQRMLAAKSEKDSIGAVLFFNLMHYAVRPWPWILVALASMIVFPDIASLQKAFPHIDPRIVQNDLSYPAMLTFLPAGALGLVVASLIAAYMSTISTHLNWGSSYIVNDFYKRFVKSEASDKELILVGRLSTGALMILSCLLALCMRNALDNFHIMLQFGAGTGLLFILRWFWWRINAASEISAMVVSGLVAIFFRLVYPRLGLPAMGDWQTLVIGVMFTTLVWVSVTLLTKPTDDKTLRSFYRLVHPGGPGWKAVIKKSATDGEAIDTQDAGWDVPIGIVCMLLGCALIWSAVLGTGYWIYGNQVPAVLLTVTAVISGISMMKLWGKLSTDKVRSNG
ncbi:MAG: sodium:solute symporter family protein [Armatimonadota bacterium]